MQPEEGRHVLQYAARPASPPAPPPRPPTGTTPPPTLCARARAEDTDKCKNFLQLIQKNPEKCSSSRNFAKRCRASCDAKYPEMNYCAQPDEENAQPDEDERPYIIGPFECAVRCHQLFGAGDDICNLSDCQGCPPCLGEGEKGPMM